MARSKLCFLLTLLLCMPGFLIAELFPGTLNRVIPPMLATVWIGAIIAVGLAGLAFWKLDEE